MPLRIGLMKESANGERIAIDILQSHPVTGDDMHTNEEMEAMLQRAIAMSDERMVDMNIRGLEAMQLQRYCAPDVWIKLRQLLEVVYGRMSAATLLSRWQSEIEETTALEHEREAAYKQQQQQMMDDATPSTGHIGNDIAHIIRPVDINKSQY